MAVFFVSLMSCFPGILFRYFLNYFEKFPVVIIIIIIISSSSSSGSSSSSSSSISSCSISIGGGAKLVGSYGQAIGKSKAII